MDKQSIDDFKQQDNPSPRAFDAFLPWACGRLQVHAIILVTKAVQHEYISKASSAQTDRTKSRKPKVTRTPSRSESSDNKSKSDMSAQGLQFMLITERIVRIFTTYDNSDNLIQLKFNKNIVIPPKIIKIISLIVQFYPYLNTVTINGGVDVNVMHELSNLLYMSNITNICLDNCFFNEATYDLLLEKQTSLKQLSLAKCKINDAVVKNIASKLTSPLPASQMLTILNLSSNRITDTGAKNIGEALRTNRCLIYLNLADNSIGDDGVASILDSLVEFPITHEEQQMARAKYMEFLKAKKDVMTRMLKEVMAADFDKKGNKKRPAKQPVSAGKKSKTSDETPRVKSSNNMNDAWLEKAEIMATNFMGEFKHAYSNQNTVLKDGIVYCTGNKTLCYLNLAYNNLSYCSLKKLLQVLKKQKISGKKTNGLINVRIEGNPLPVSCIEMVEIDDILETGLIEPSFMKKKTPLKIGK